MTGLARAAALAACAAALTAGVSWLQPSAPSPQGVAVREDAYRANNLGVARLEQYDFPAATAAFRRALEIDSNLALARLNLGIALFYAGEPDAARTELEAVRSSLPDRPHAEYVLGLIARSADRTEDAIAAFTKVRSADAGDVGAAINLGQLHLQQRQYAQALEVFRTATQAEPYNATAAYGLATALIRSGAADQGRAAMETFQKLRDSGYAVTFSQTYLEQGRYAEAIASTGAETALVDTRVPDVTFVEANTPIAAATPAPPSASTGFVALIDIDTDGDLDLADADGSTLRFFRNDAGKFTDATSAWFTSGTVPSAIGLVAGDYDNDSDVDLLVLRTSGPALYRQEAGARFVDATAESAIAFQGVARTAAWLDVDHDGDLDLLLATSEPQAAVANRLFRNNGDGRFVDITKESNLSFGRGVVATVPTDYDNRRDIDVLAVPAAGGPLLFRNLRDGTFRDVAADVGLTAEGRLSMAAAGDLNKDGYTDFFFPRRDAVGLFAMSDGRGRFSMQAAPPETADARTAQFVDYDNDGLLDLILVTSRGARVLRNVGDRWSDVTTKAMAVAANEQLGDAALATGDVDGDGDTDLVVRSAAGLKVWRNEGANRSRSLGVRLTARVSNRSAAGAKIEMRAGSLRQRFETYAATPAPAPASVLFGFGDRAGADVLRVLWPSGILQAETAEGGSLLTGVLTVEELDRKPSSCPYLYTWNGERFEFLTDFLGGGEMGYWLAPGVRNEPDPDEYVRIPGDRLKPLDGRLELRVTNELEEAVFLDRLQLVAVAHPADVGVYPNEGLRSTREPFRLVTTHHSRPPLAAVDEHGHDVLDLISRVDRRYPDDFRLERIRGYAAEHSLTLTLPPSSDGRRALLLTGWTDYAFSGDNVAAHQSGLRMVPPLLQVLEPGGTWRTVIDDIGFPAGRPQTFPVDLTGRVPDDAQRVRIVTTMRVYWDQVLVDTSNGRANVVTSRLDPIAATLGWRGFSAEHSPDGREPFSYVYEKVSPTSPWKQFPGRYTREGDVRELLLATDDRFVIARPGDEIAVAFDASTMAPLRDGWTWTFLLFTDGFSKEMDLNSATPDELGPLPFHGMKRYPYSASDVAPTEAQREYTERYNTRIISRSIPPIELVAPVTTELPTAPRQR